MENSDETPVTMLGEILFQGLQQNQERQLGAEIHFGFKDPSCDASNEAYRGWTLFAKGDASGNLQLRFRNDHDVDLTISGDKAEIAQKIDEQDKVPSSQDILNLIAADASRRNQVYEAWKAAQTQTATAAVAETIAEQ